MQFPPWPSLPAFPPRERIERCQLPILCIDISPNQPALAASPMRMDFVTDALRIPRRAHQIKVIPATLARAFRAASTERVRTGQPGDKPLAVACNLQSSSCRRPGCGSRWPDYAYRCCCTLRPPQPAVPIPTHRRDRIYCNVHIDTEFAFSCTRRRPRLIQRLEDSDPGPRAPSAHGVTQ